MEPKTIALGTLDVAFFLLSLAVSLVVGLYFATRNKNLNEYMLGGRSQKLLPVSLSMMTSFVSGLTLIGSPSEFYYHGIGFGLEIFGCLLSVPISALILLPVFHRLGGISVFGYLEERFGAWFKRMSSIIFMLTMVLYNAVVLYVPSLSLKSVLGISETYSIGAVGASCLLYSTLGGIKAVIWTDFFQAGLMYLSMICICIFGTKEAGGFRQVVDLNIVGERLSMDEFFNVDTSTRHTVFILVTGIVLINVFMNGANQIQVQRVLSLSSLRMGQWSLLLAAIFTILISLLSTYSGLVLYAIFSDCDPYEDQQIEKRDALVIYYVAKHLAHLPGLRGIFVAGIFASTLSTLSSFQNSMSALMLEDFIKPAMSNSSWKMSEQTVTYLSKVIALIFGATCIGLTFLVGRISGLLQVAYTLFGVLGGPMIASFLLGMLTRVVNSCGMTIGSLAGFIFGFYVQTMQLLYLPPLEPTKPISTLYCPADSNATRSYYPGATLESHGWLIDMAYFWLPVFSGLVTSLVAILVSLATGGWNQEVDDKYLVSWLHKRGQPGFKSSSSTRC